ncbi:hypothetical protein B0H63DRAFT_485788 [Podospora didyma]|uniref:NRPS-like enzyme n=1 Tax=Podospora didyma TaxID=330526 RepID=A0AAE0N4H6_9PEZI|nr:hypothetical protein B0H63DRAFT_485788 [Podospora didyma]
MRWNFGSVYRRIFCLAFLANAAVLCYLVARWLAKGDVLTAKQASLAVTANILAAIVVRNEHIVNALFWTFSGAWVAEKLPLWARRLLAKVYSYGGIHSSGAVCGTLWYIVFLVLLTRELVGKSSTILRSYIFFVSYFIILLLCTMLATAHPHLRRVMHNWFEGIHRWMGWLAVVLFWVQAVLVAADDDSKTTIGGALLVSPGFWMLVVITLLVVYPWTRLRAREVTAEVLSEHCVKLNFSYRDVHYGQAVRLTDAPLRETHAFGVIPHPPAPLPIKKKQWHCVGCNCRGSSVAMSERAPSSASLSSSSSITMSDDILKKEPACLSHAGERGFSVIVSNAGDWTRKIIQNPPKKIYTRGTPQFGVMRVAGLFKPCIIVATGSGIAPCLSLFVQRPEHPVRIVWSAKAPLATYGQAVVDLLYRTDPRAVIIDTDKVGRRPDLVKIVYRVWEQSQGQTTENRNGGDAAEREGKEKCEAVVVISNQKLTKKVVYGLETRGVPAYGAIFDS